MLNEKEPLSATEKPAQRSSLARCIVYGVLLVVALNHLRAAAPVPTPCKQPPPLFPSFNVSSLVVGQDQRILDWLSGAVKIPTENYDDMDELSNDPRWEVFYKFSAYLEDSFPLAHAHLNRTRVNTHGLIYEWYGSDSALKPLLLTGHQDVVPVLPATRGQWSHDPYGGEYDAATDRIWGRGTADDKSGVIGILSAIELLIESSKFTPTRTVILSFGFDEETGGKRGATSLSAWLETKYGRDSMAMQVDEGSGMMEVWGQLYATPAVAEKGYLDVEIKVETLGGHSSVPPPHTGIGYASLIIAQLESHPHSTYLNRESPLVNFLSCVAQTAPEFPPGLKRSVDRAAHDKRALKSLEDWWVYDSSTSVPAMKPGMGKAMVSTTQAIDVVRGGLKVNALPEVVTITINHRVSIAETTTQLQHRLGEVVTPVAKEYDLALEAFGKVVHTGAAGKVTISVAFNST